MKAEAEKPPLFTRLKGNWLHPRFIGARLNLSAQHIEHRNPAWSAAGLPLGKDPRILRFKVSKIHNGAPMRWKNCSRRVRSMSFCWSVNAGG